VSSTGPSARAAEALDGVTPPRSTGHAGFLSDVIVELGFAPREAVEKAVRAARSPGTTVARVLLEMGAIDEEQLARATAERYGIDYVDLDGFRVDAAAANLIEPAIPRRYRAVPVARLGTGLLVAMADPADALGLNDIAAMTGLAVRPAVASRPALDALLEALPLDEPAEAPPLAKPAEAPPLDEPARVEPAGPAVVPAPPAAQAPPAEPPRLREELEALKRRLAGAEAKLTGGTSGAGEADRLRSRLAAAEAELEEARLRLREAKEVGAELETLREKLDRAEAERAQAGLGAPGDHAATGGSEELHTQLAAVTQERDRLRSELEAARESSEHARHALAALREEADRERERWAMSERDLRDALAEEELRRGELEKRLGEVEEAAFAADRAFEELRVAQRRMQGALRELAGREATDEH
jgi:hypothetical protein